MSGSKNQERNVVILPSKFLIVPHLAKLKQTTHPHEVYTLGTNREGPSSPSFFYPNYLNQQSPTFLSRQTSNSGSEKGRFAWANWSFALLPIAYMAWFPMGYIPVPVLNPQIGEPWSKLSGFCFSGMHSLSLGNLNYIPSQRQNYPPLQCLHC